MSKSDYNTMKMVFSRDAAKFYLHISEDPELEPIIQVEIQSMRLEDRNKKTIIYGYYHPINNQWLEEPNWYHKINWYHNNDEFYIQLHKDITDGMMNLLNHANWDNIGPGKNYIGWIYCNLFPEDKP
jgi:hypothetical protein